MLGQLYLTAGFAKYALGDVGEAESAIREAEKIANITGQFRAQAQLRPDCDRLLADQHAGRRRRPGRRRAYDLAKLLRKEPVRSETASWIFVAGPRVYFAAALAATTLVPVLFAAAPLESAGGILLLVGTLALGRFALATAALDTGSPFGGMGASRDMTIAALAEPALMLGLFTSALAGGLAEPGRPRPVAARARPRRSIPATCSPSPASSSSSSPKPAAFRWTTRPRTSS